MNRAVREIGKEDTTSGVCLKGRRRKISRCRKGQRNGVCCRRRREECERPEVSLMS